MLKFVCMYFRITHAKKFLAGHDQHHTYNIMTIMSNFKKYCFFQYQISVFN
jgi:hypothetical protein